ncbi:hypothetical protein MKX03_004345 [Papaver bracteatum]|nr:hypothetical protein MKX03_004345 [Papaver bracteatum]
MASIFMTMSKKPVPTVVSSNNLKNKLGLVQNPNPKRSAVSSVPIFSFPLNMMKNKKGSHISDAHALRPSFTTDLLSSADVFDSGMEEMKLYDKEEKDVMMKRWSINLPGFGKDDVKVTVEGTSLVITTLLGKEKLGDVVGPDVVNGDSYYVYDSDDKDDMNTFISFDLLDLDFLNLQELKAEMKNGLLKISILKVKVEEKNVILVKVD